MLQNITSDNGLQLVEQRVRIATPVASSNMLATVATATTGRVYAIYETTDPVLDVNGDYFAK
jgi:hypothetical protein